MAQETSLRVGVDSRPAEEGAKRGKKALRGLQGEARRTETQFQKLQRSMGGFRAVLGGIGVGLVVREFSQLIDSATNIDNRLRLVTKTGAEVNAVFEELVAISNETRTGLESNAALFNRMALATKEMGLTFQEQLDLTRSLNQALVISGASAAEGGAGLIQLSQGLAAGALRGDELRSVLEGLPKVADVIAEGLGVTRGELRKLGEAGKISAQAVVEAFQKAAPALSEEFKKITPTIESAFTVFNNKMLEFTRNMNKTSGVGRFLAEGILKLGDNFNVLATVAAGAAVIIGGVLVRSLLKMTIALATNPVGLLIIAFGALTTALGIFGDTTTMIGGEVVTGWQQIEAAVLTAWGFIKPVFDLWGEAFGVIGAAVSDFASGFGIELSGVSSFMQRWASVVLGIFGAIPKSIIAFFEDIPGSLKLLFIKAFNGILATAEFLINGFAKVIAKVGDLVSVFDEEAGAKLKSGIENALSVDFGRLSITDDAAAVGDKLSAIWEDAFRTDRLDDFGSSYEKNLNIIIERDKAAAVSADLLNGRLVETNRLIKESEEIIKARAKFTAQMQKDFDQLRMSTGRATEVLMEWAEAQRSELKRLGLENSEYADQFEQIFAHRLPEARRADLFAATDSASGIAQAMDQYVTSLGSAAEQTRSLFGDAFLDAEDALVDFVKTGKLSFDSLIDNMVAGLIRLAAQEALSGLFGSLGFGGGGGKGLSGLFSALPGFASGGSFEVGGKGGVDKNVVGFRATRGETVTVTPEGQSRGGGVTVQMNINTPDANSFRKSKSQIMSDFSRGLTRAQRNL